MPLHPSIVHFPPVLLLSAAVIYGVGILRKRPQLEVMGFLFHGAGLIFCILAIFTGDYEADRLAGDTSLQAAIGRHENLVMIATYAFGVMGIWAFLRQKGAFVWEKWLFLLVFSGLVVLLGIGAHLGGKLVYEEGAGIQLPSTVQADSASGTGAPPYND